MYGALFKTPAGSGGCKYVFVRLHVRLPGGDTVNQEFLGSVHRVIQTMLDSRISFFFKCSYPFFYPGYAAPEAATEQARWWLRVLGWGPRTGPSTRTGAYGCGRSFKTCS